MSFIRAFVGFSQSKKWLMLKYRKVGHLNNRKIITTMNKYLYQDFLENKETYKNNVFFWVNIIKNILSPEKHEYTEYISTTDNLGNEFFDGNPISNLLVERLNKAVRIIQEKPGTNKIILFSAWLNEIELQEGQSIDELVISLELTQETALLTVDLISAWILRDLTKFRMKEYIKTMAILRDLITRQQTEFAV